MYANCHVTLPSSRLDLRSSLSWWTVGLQVMIGSGKLGKQEIFADANLPDSTINQVMDGPANLDSGALEVHPLGYWALCTGIVLLRRLIAGWGSLIWSPSVNFICLHRISLANLSRCFETNNGVLVTCQFTFLVSVRVLVLAYSAMSIAIHLWMLQYSVGFCWWRGYAHGLVMVGAVIN